jgi:hypothetical protein
MLDGCGVGNTSAISTVPAKVSPGDVATINRLIDVEYYAAAAYTAGVPLLRSHNLRLAKRFLNQELSHIGQLTQLLHSVHAPPRLEAPSYNLDHPRDATEVLELFHRVEQLVVRTYLSVIEMHAPGPIQSTFVAILANEAQHVSIIRRNLGLSEVPAALLSAVE